MLFTRCPDCETTFRITADALRKADGQVRCGRCARVFNAYNELRRRSRRRAAAASEQAVAASEQTVAASEQTVAASEQAAAARAPAAEATRRDDAAGGKRIGGKASAETAAVPGGDAVAVRPGAKSASSASRPAAPTTASDGASSAVAAATARARAARRESRPAIAPASNATAKIPGDEKDSVVGDISLSGVLAELDASAHDDAEADEAIKPGDVASPEAAKPDAPSTTALLAKNGLSAGVGTRPRTLPDRAEGPEAADTLDAPPAWVMLEDPPRKRATTRVWTVGCIIGTALLALQVLHHYRANIAVLGVVGPVIQDAYAMLGAEVAPAWDLDQYEIVVDWDAVTQPSPDGQSNLTIAARIRNKGPRALPLPHVQVQLKDRWESTIGSRVFAPSEYLPRGARLDRLMTEGQTMLAELDILDPGPQAYGFELDVCVDAEADALRCAADEVFR